MVRFRKGSALVLRVLALLKTKFDIKVLPLGKIWKLLGVQFDKTTSGIVIHQTSYIDEICKRFCNFKILLPSLPISKFTVFPRKDCPVSQSDVEQMSCLSYRSVLGCISFVASRTRFDLSYAMNVLNQFQSNPGIPH